MPNLRIANNPNSNPQIALTPGSTPTLYLNQNQPENVYSEAAKVSDAEELVAYKVTADLKED